MNIWDEEEKLLIVVILYGGLILILCSIYKFKQLCTIADTFCDEIWWHAFLASECSAAIILLLVQTVYSHRAYATLRMVINSIKDIHISVDGIEKAYIWNKICFILSILAIVGHLIGMVA
jgi:hypothetical protein